MLTDVHVHDLPAENGVARILARKALWRALPTCVVPVIGAFMGFFAFTESVFEVVWGTPDYGSLIADLILLAIIGFFVWGTAQQMGTVLFGAFIPPNAPHTHLREGVSCGDLTVQLTDDAIVWRYARFHEEFHISRFYRFMHKRHFLILECCPAVRHFIKLEKPRHWIAMARQNKKTANATGWRLPMESPEMRHFDLPQDVYVAAKIRDDDGSITCIGVASLLTIPVLMLGICGFALSQAISLRVSILRGLPFLAFWPSSLPISYATICHCWCKRSAGDPKGFRRWAAT